MMTPARVYVVYEVTAMPSPELRDAYETYMRETHIRDFSRPAASPERISLPPRRDRFERRTSRRGRRSSIAISSSTRKGCARTLRRISPRASHSVARCGRSSRSGRDERRVRSVAAQLVANASAWSAAVRERRIESRRTVTDAAIVAAVLEQNPRRVLDVGCGEGWLARALSAHGIDVTGIDTSAPLIEAARPSAAVSFSR